MGGTMVTITGLIIGAAIFLLCWYFFVPGAKELFDEENNKRLKEEREWQERRLAERAKYSPVTALASQKSTGQIGSAEDWTILAYYTPKVYDWLEDKVTLSKCDKVACQQLRDRLETSVQWTDKNKQVHAGVSRIEYEAIHIMNNITNRTLTISWKDNEVIAGTWIDFGAHSEYIRVEDSK